MAELATTIAVWCICAQGRVKKGSEPSDRASKSTTCIWRQASPKNVQVTMASVHNCNIELYSVHQSEVARCCRFTLVSHAFFMAREATGAQEDAWSKRRRRHEQPLRPDLSLTIQNNLSLQLHGRFSSSVTEQRRRRRQCLLSAGT